MRRLAIRSAPRLRGRSRHAGRTVVRAGRRRASIGDGLASVVAIVVAMLFFFPLYWAISNSLRKPAETFTVTGLGIPFVNFTPTMENWSQHSACRNSMKRS